MKEEKCADSMMSFEDAEAFMFQVAKELGFLDEQGEVRKDLRTAVASHARMLSRRCPYTYEEEACTQDSGKELP